MNKELFKDLMGQAFEEELPRVGPGVFGALPNDFGRAIQRLTELCEENGICHMCAYLIDECSCDERSSK